MDGTSDAPYALDYSESMAFFNNAYNPSSAQAITATEFDIAQELLWAGSNEVHPSFEISPLIHAAVLVFEGTCRLLSRL